MRPGADPDRETGKHDRHPKDNRDKHCDQKPVIARHSRYSVTLTFWPVSISSSPSRVANQSAGTDFRRNHWFIVGRWTSLCP